MAMNGLEAIYAALSEQADAHEIKVDESIRLKALIPLNRMLDFAANLQQKISGNI